MDKKQPNHRPLGQTLEQMERDDPVVREAARRYNATVKELLEGRIHRLPCLDLSCKWHHET